jgi:hypothetical protein
MRRVRSVVITLYVSVFGMTCTSILAQARESMLFSCLEKPFLSVSVSTPNEDVASAVQIKLVDPTGHQQGYKLRGTPIPRSHYEEVVEVPNAPTRSLVRAVEICDAEAGQYELTIYEHGSDRYRIKVVSAESNADLYALEMRLNSRSRTRRYHLIFKIAGHQPSVSWLDGQGREQMHIENSDW